MSPVKLTFDCSGCFITAEGTDWPRSESDRFQDFAPEGWIAFDPWTKCCYCPKCWKELQKGVDHAE